MAKHTLTLKRIEAHPKVDNDCFFSFLSDKGDMYFVFKAEKRNSSDSIPEPPIGDSFTTLRCAVHQLVIPPLMGRVPFIIRTDDREPTQYAKEMVQTGGRNQRINIISEFEELEPQAGSYDYLGQRDNFWDDDFSIPHYHHLGPVVTKEDSQGSPTRSRKGRDDGTCPVGLHSYGRPDELIMTSLDYLTFKQNYPDRGLPDWLLRMNPELAMHTVLMELSGGEVVHAYHPIEDSANRAVFTDRFSNAQNVVFGMPTCRPIDAMDIFLIDATDDLGITRSDDATVA